MTGATEAGSWTCAQCQRRVPMRIPACRCGATKPAPAAGAAPLPTTPAAPRAARQPAPARPSAAGAFDEDLRSPKERTLFMLGAAFSGLVWLLMVVSIVGIFYGAVGLVFGLVIHALFLAHVRGNGLRVSERQLPEVHAAVVKSSLALGLAETPEVYVMQAGGALNAFATKLLTRKFVIIYSDLVDACQDPRQLEFVIAHEVGHLAAGHLKWNAFLWPFMLVPLLGMAYSRAREYTCDRCGLAVVNDQEMAMRGLIVLAAGGMQAARADIPAFIEQRLETGRFWSAVVELGATHPYLCKRVAEVQEIAHPGSLQPVGRNPFAYPLAPFLAFGSMAGGGMTSLLMMVFIIGIIAAIAIPSLLRARVAANEAGAIGNIRSVVSAEVSFAQVAGRYGSLGCLVSPSRCMPNYPGPAFLDAEFANETRQGYKQSLSLSPDSRAYVLQADPLQPGQTGMRFFCADATGVICASTQSVTTNGFGCDLSRCQPLR